MSIVLCRFRPQAPLLCKFSPKYQNCLFILKFGTETNSSVLNAVVIFKFAVFDNKLLCWQILSKTFKLPAEAEMRYIEKFEYVELNGFT